MHPNAKLTVSLVLTAGLAVLLAWWMARPAETELREGGGGVSQRISRPAGATAVPDAGAPVSGENVASRLGRLVSEKPSGWQAEIARLLADLNLAEFPRLLEAIVGTALPKEAERLLLDDFFATWGKRDPQSAMAAAVERRSKEDAKAVLKGWSTVADRDAWNWVENHVGDRGHEVVAGAKPEYYGAVIHGLVSVGRDETALDLAMNRTSPAEVGPYRSAAIADYGRSLATRDPQAASEWLKTIQGEDSLTIHLSTSALGSSLAQKGPDDLLRILTQHSESTQDNMIQAALTSWTFSRPLKNGRFSRGVHPSETF